MKLYSDITLKQAKDDYEYITKNYGQPCDFCGSLCNCDLLFDLLESKLSRKEGYIQMIQYIWTNGLEPEHDYSVNGITHSNIRPDEEDERIKTIKDRYLID